MAASDNIWIHHDIVISLGIFNIVGVKTGGANRHLLVECVYPALHMRHAYGVFWPDCVHQFISSIREAVSG